MYNLKNSVPMMLSGDVNHELMAEYIQTYIRYQRLKDQMGLILKDASDRETKAIIMQKIDMLKYLNLLKVRLQERNIDIDDEDIDINTSYN